jgi:hypothetical protein
LRPVKLKVMPDYFCWPIWHDGGSQGVGPIDPSTLPLSARLVQEFEVWQEEYDQSLNMADPPASRLADESRFEREGRRLARALQAELGTTYAVRYWTEGTQR